MGSIQAQRTNQIKRRINIERRKKMQKARRGREPYDPINGIVTLISFALFLALIFWMKGMGLIIALPIVGFVCFTEGRQFLYGSPKLYGKSTFSRDHDPLHGHVPDCPDCEGLGRKRKPFLTAFFAHNPTLRCPFCLGCGKIRHKDMEWYYLGKE